MTEAARMVLRDVRGALDDLKDGIQGPTWRRRWITAVVLLRAVGHVLIKVDGKNHRIKPIVDRWWDNIKDNKSDHQIFWDFIDKQRNFILKEYDMGAGQGVIFYVAPGTVSVEGRRPILMIGDTPYNAKQDSCGNNTEDICQKQYLKPGPSETGRTEYIYKINSGTYKGMDQRDAILEAISWWETQLDEIDARSQCHAE